MTLKELGRTKEDACYQLRVGGQVSVPGGGSG